MTIIGAFEIADIKSLIFALILAISIRSFLGFRNQEVGFCCYVTEKRSTLAQWCPKTKKFSRYYPVKGTRRIISEFDI